MKLATLARTIRHLRPSQLGYLALNRLRARFLGPPVGSGGRGVEQIGWTAEGEFPQPLCGSADEWLAGRFEFLDQSHELGFPPRDWSPQQATRLWTYNLHYFDWLWSLPPDAAAVAVDDWMAKHTPRRGKAGWEAYPMSLRLMNWAGYFCARHRAFFEAPERTDFRKRLLASMSRQADCLLRCQEKHLLANHYLENGAALSVAGACFAGQPGASAWWAAGLRILDEELAEQCPPDGLHFERSPMYHLRLVYMLQVLMACDHADLRQRAEPVLDRALAALARVVHPDGEIALLADSALGVYPMPKIAPPPVGAFALADAGYFGYRSENGDYIICDFGEPSPAYNPGHSHAGLFSFELSVAGRRLISDTGAATYRPGEERTWARSTAAHNTVELDGQDQAEVWGAFRMGRRPRVQNVRWTPSGENGVPGFVIEAQHDGYRCGSNPRTHWRRISFDADARCLRIEDRIEAQNVPTQARIAFHTHPGIEVKSTGDSAADLLHQGQSLATIRFAVDAEDDPGAVDLETRSTLVFRRFHCGESRQSLFAAAHGRRLARRCEIFLKR